MPAVVRLGDLCGGHGCLLGETLIKLMNGTSKRIDDLVGQKNFYVYSLDQANKKIIPGRVESVFKTGIKECIKITLDNGKEVVASTDHKFIMKNGRRILAEKLKLNDSLMALYTRIQSEKWSRKGYEWLLHPNGEWQQTHRISYYWKYGKFLEKAGLYIAHHRDFNTFNNSPDNITACKWHDHQTYHAIVLKRKFEAGTHYCQTEKGIETLRIRNTTNNPAKNPVNMLKMVATRKAHPLGYLQGKSIITSKGRQIIYNNMIKKNPMKDPSTVLKVTKTRCASVRGYKNWNELINSIVIRSQNEDFDSILKDMKLTDTKNYVDWKPEILKSYPQNHKIVKIEHIGKKEVYNMSVAISHSYAIDAGIIINNCWPPRPNVTASPDVFADNKAMHRVGDTWAVHCLHGDTKVLFLDGTSLKIKDINSNNNLYTYSCTEEGKIVSGKIINSFVSGTASVLIELELDNGKKFKCSTDHLIMLRSGEYIKASELTTKHSIMPLYRQIEKVLTTDYNHKIHKIKFIYLNQPIDLYDLTIENNENTHNFALECGIFVHNCCIPDCHPGTQATGSPTVSTNSKAQARIGDSISCGSHDAQGSPDVFADDS